MLRSNATGVKVAEIRHGKVNSQASINALALVIAGTSLKILCVLVKRASQGSLRKARPVARGKSTQISRDSLLPASAKRSAPSIHSKPPPPLHYRKVVLPVHRVSNASLAHSQALLTNIKQDAETTGLTKLSSSKEAFYEWASLCY